MLQRVQTVWTFLAAIIAALTFKFTFYSGNIVVGSNGHLYQSVSAGRGFLLPVIAGLLIAGCLIAIFNYKNRKRQLWITIALLVVSLLNIVEYWHESGTPPFIEGHYDITAFLPLAIPVFLILAARGIMKDQKLVKSADRLR